MPSRLDTLARGETYASHQIRLCLMELLLLVLELLLLVDARVIEVVCEYIMYIDVISAAAALENCRGSSARNDERHFER